MIRNANGDDFCDWAAGPIDQQLLAEVLEIFKPVKTSDTRKVYWRITDGGTAPMVRHAR